MMNLKGCKDIRGGRSSVAGLTRSEELIAKAEAELKKVEAFAQSRGLGNALEAGRVRFEKQIAEELNTLCDPDEQSASRRAHEAIQNFQDRLVELSRRR